MSEYVCKEVELSFAVINQHGVSDFSPIKRICVEGKLLLTDYYLQTNRTFCSGVGSTLSPPPNVEITFEEKVVGILTSRGTFTVDISWTHPTGRFMISL